MRVKPKDTRVIQTLTQSKESFIINSTLIISSRMTKSIIIKGRHISDKTKQISAGQNVRVSSDL